MHALTGRRSSLALALAATLVVAIESLAARQIPTSSAPRLLTGAILFDLLIAAPAAYWWLFLRRRASVLRLAPVLAATMLICWLILPESQRHLLSALRVLTIPVEVLVSALAVRAAIRAARAGTDSGLLERIRIGTQQALPWPTVANLVASEIAVIAYACLSWRWPVEAPVGTTPFSGHRRSGYAGLAVALIGVTMLEGAAVHLLVAPWSRFVALGLSILTGYGILWILGDLRALQLRPTLVAEDALHLRVGLRWSATLPWDRIAGVEAAPRGAMGAAPLLRVTPIGPPSLVIVLREPVALQGPLGIVRRGDRIGLAADDPRGLRAAIEERIQEDRS
jgi:hypothetical protein